MLPFGHRGAAFSISGRGGRLDTSDEKDSPLSALVRDREIWSEEKLRPSGKKPRLRLRTVANKRWETSRPLV